MRNKYLPLLFALILLCAACTAPNKPSDATEQGEYKIYFVSDAHSETGERYGSADSGALGSETAELPDGVSEVESLLGLLMAGPNSAELTSPFPNGVQVRTWERKNGRVTVDLSESYNGLAGVELTLADSCIVLTLCQLDDVEEVYITVEGRRRPFRDLVYTAESFVKNNRDTPAPSVEEENTEPPVPSETAETE